MYVCMYIYIRYVILCIINTDVKFCLCMYACMYVCVLFCMYVYMYVCMYYKTLSVCMYVCTTRYTLS